ncbi:lambda-exonuclease family protein [Pseudomonas aeruginosa]|nr:YqaJ viral recombinase family protein [Pseudomonas aeruginosa]MCC9289608.1 YqaJ viral recombinase family protein [Pseudomonas aeruginosa]UVN18856.1 Putative DNA recombination protein [Pseudomonas aeruginosa]
MTIVDIAQGTPDWHEWRRVGISATSCAVIMGENADKTPLELWKELVGIVEPADLSVMPQVRSGVKFEALALQAIEDKYGKMALPYCAESTAYPLIRASFDGVLDDKSPVEFKNLSETNDLELLQLREHSMAFKLYRWQVMQQMIVSGARRGYLWFWSPKHQPCCSIVDWDDHLVRRIIQAEVIFWRLVMRRVPPEADPMRDVIPLDRLDVAAWRPLAIARRAMESKFAELKAQFKVLTKEAEDLEAEILLLLGEFRRTDALGVNVTSYEVAGTVDRKGVAHEQEAVIPPDLIARHQSGSSKATRDSVDGSYDESKAEPEPLPRIRHKVDAIYETVDEPSQIFGTFWF